MEDGPEYEPLETKIRLSADLLNAIKQRKTELEQMLERASDDRLYEDGIYRFYHQSFKVFGLQMTTEAIVEVLRSLLPGRTLNCWFSRIIAEGTGKEFEMEMNARWLEETRPIVEAFFHARYMLEMAVRSSSLATPPRQLPYGWAALLYLYDLR